MGESLQLAYIQYMEDMYSKSDDLVDVAEETIPEDRPVNIPVMLEWCDIV